jgi:hypothetical protein
MFHLQSGQRSVLVRDPRNMELRHQCCCWQRLARSLRGQRRFQAGDSKNTQNKLERQFQTLYFCCELLMLWAVPSSLANSSTEKLAALLLRETISFRNTLTKVNQGFNSRFLAYIQTVYTKRIYSTYPLLAEPSHTRTNAQATPHCSCNVHNQ